MKNSPKKTVSFTTLLFLCINVTSQNSLSYEKCSNSWYQYTESNEVKTDLTFYPDNIVVKLVSKYHYWGRDWFEIYAGKYEITNDSLIIKYNWEMTIDSICQYLKNNKFSEYENPPSNSFFELNTEIYSIQDSSIILLPMVNKLREKMKGQVVHSISSLVQNGKFSYTRNLLFSQSDSILISNETGLIFLNSLDSSKVEIQYPDFTIYIDGIRTENFFNNVSETKIKKGQIIGYMPKRRKKFKCRAFYIN